MRAFQYGSRFPFWIVISLYSTPPPPPSLAFQPGKMSLVHRLLCRGTSAVNNACNHLFILERCVPRDMEDREECGKRKEEETRGNKNNSSSTVCTRAWKTRDRVGRNDHSRTHYGSFEGHLFCSAVHPGLSGKTADAIHALSDSKRLGDNLHARSSV